MSRYSRFARDLHAIHGEAEVRRIDDFAQVPRITAISLVFLLCVGVAVLAVFLAGFVLGLVIFGYSAFVDHPQVALYPQLISEAVGTIFAKA